MYFLLIVLSLISGFDHPESVLPSGNVLYVSNIGRTLDATGKDGDGYISCVDLTTHKVTHFFDSLDAPKGMALYGQTLYVADIDHIVGIDIPTRRRVLDLPIPGTHFLNDLALGDGKLYASATDNGKVYEIDLSSLSCRALPLSDTVTGANGLCYDGAHHLLYCVGVGHWGSNDGRVVAIDLSSFSVTPLCNYRGLLDGVDRVGDTLYFSDWRGVQDSKGVILALDLRSHAVSEVPLGGGAGAARTFIAGPADFCVHGVEFIVPETLTGKILFIPRP
ncbi:YncE family protein [Dinghuibacter silviterrae]|uniref:Uncharacterized protein n=1 Tax=Dinghuibacter silviterrae TaxID=1539049 RepID=A0A4R8DGA3_9BACT|nr:hypothetical protein [Dinghuibacter silviterrae]TDW96398.1 hypothetical protein EDB95_4227 [Dinghuibacter silviterrae]